MNVNADGNASHSLTILWVGEVLVTTSMAIGIVILCYFSTTSYHPRAVRLIIDDWWSFIKNSVPYQITFLMCWFLSLLFKNMIASNGLVADLSSKRFFFTFKFVLNSIAFGTKFILFYTRSKCMKTIMFMSNLITMATIDVMCHVKYDRGAINIAGILLFSLTTLILVRFTKKRIHEDDMEFIDRLHRQD